VSPDLARYDTLLLIYFEQFPQVANSPPPWGKVAVLPAYSLFGLMCHFIPCLKFNEDFENLNNIAYGQADGLTEQRPRKIHILLGGGNYMVGVLFVGIDV